MMILRKPMKYLMACSLWMLPCIMQAQDDVTNAFEDLKRQGIVGRGAGEGYPAGSALHGIHS